MTTEEAATYAGQLPTTTFHQHFRQQVRWLQDEVDTLASPDLPASDRKPRTEACLSGITSLSAELADASGDLPSYDQRSYNQALKELQDKLAITQASHAPKAKFSFKSKRPAVPSSSPAIASEASSAATSLSVPPSQLHDRDSATTRDRPTPALALPPTHLGSTYSSHTILGTADANDREPTAIGNTMSTLPTLVNASESRISNDGAKYSYLTYPGSEIEGNNAAAVTGQNCIVTNISSSIVNLVRTARMSSPTSTPQYPPSLTINDVVSSFLLASHVNGPAHITGVSNSIIVLSCHQFRMHQSHNVDVYLFCTSRPIIEDCSNIRFATIPDEVARLNNGPYQSASNSSAGSKTGNESVLAGKNMFDQVDDFKWLRAEPSPNWKLMAQEDNSLQNNVAVSLLKDFLDNASGRYDVQTEAVQSLLEHMGLDRRTK